MEIAPYYLVKKRRAGLPVFRLSLNAIATRCFSARAFGRGLALKQCLRSHTRKPPFSSTILYGIYPMLAYCQMFLKLAVAGGVHSYTGLSTADTPRQKISSLDANQAGHAPPCNVPPNTATISEHMESRNDLQ